MLFLLGSKLSLPTADDFPEPLLLRIDLFQLERKFGPFGTVELFPEKLVLSHTGSFKGLEIGLSLC